MQYIEVVCFSPSSQFMNTLYQQFILLLRSQFIDSPISIVMEI